MPIRCEHTQGQLALYRDGGPLPLLTQMAVTDTRPYIHPLLSPDGVGEMTENQPGHHLWQHGLYVGLNDVNGVGFWTEGLTGSALDGTFHPRPLAEPEIVDSNTVSWEVVTDWRAPDGAPLLTETQCWRFTDNGATYLLDLDWTLAARTALRFGQYSYGGLFLRMPWRAETGGDILSSEGARSHETAEAQRARWVALSMPVPGRSTGPVGVAFFDHPTNPEHPNPWRVDGNLGIVPSRCIAGGWSLSAGTETLSRYRLYVFQGPIDAATIEAEWARFAREQKESEYP
jgi:hypothetical protein